MAAVTLRQKPVTVDTNVLIDLADRNTEVEAALKAIRKRLKGTPVVITPTVVQELAWLVENGDDEETRRLAYIATHDLRSRWQIYPINCEPEWHGVIGLAAQELRERGLLPVEEESDALIIAESSLADCVLLMSSDGHMWECDVNAVNAVLVGRHLNSIAIIPPWQIAKNYG